MRPLGTLIESLNQLEKSLKQEPRPFHFVVVGGGASGCELALAIHKRLGAPAGFRMTLLQGNDRILPHFPEAAAQPSSKPSRTEELMWCGTPASSAAKTAD